MLHTTAEHSADFNFFTMPSEEKFVTIFSTGNDVLVVDLYR